MKRFITKRLISLALAVIITMLTITPVFASGLAVDEEGAGEGYLVVTDEFVMQYEIPQQDYMILHVNGRPTSPISLMFMDGRSYANLQEAAYALSATVTVDDDGVVRWTPAGGRILSIVFDSVGVLEYDDTQWVLEDFVWEVFFLTQDRFFTPAARDDIPYAAPVVRTTDHGELAVSLIQIMNNTLYNRVPFSYRELDAAYWIKAQLIEMGHNEDYVMFQTFTIEDLIGNFMGSGVGMYEQFNVFDPDARLTLDDAIDAIVEMIMEQEREWIERTAEQMNITFEEAKVVVAENAGMSVDFLYKFMESFAREMAPFQLNMATVFGLFDENTQFRPKSQNVILTVPGQSERKIIVTAHYDSIMTPGASDNASGTALLLESAYRLLGVENYFTIVYVFMGAEEIGLLGAFYYVESLTPAERNNIVLNINADVLFEGPYFFFGAGIRDEDGWWLADNDITLLIGEVAEYVNAAYGAALINAQPLAEMPSDQLAFLQGGHTVVTLVGLARAGAEGYEQFPAWHMYPGFSASIVHTEFDDYHFINATWPNKIGDAMWTFSLFLEYLLVAEFDYRNLPEIGIAPRDVLLQVDLADHPLVGTWAWNDDAEWTFVFNPDGTGQRGLPDDMVEFTWSADDFNLFIQVEGSSIIENWQLFGIHDDELMLGLQWRNFIYMRQ